MRAIHIDQSITHRDEHSLQLYLNELDGMELITAAEEVVLAKKIKAGDQAALQKLVKANLRFVVSCAKKYQRLGLPLADLVSEGNMGLIKAAQLFDESRGFKFISYAVWWIRQSMMMALSNQARMIRLPGNMVKSTAEIRKTADQLEQLLERMPTEQEIKEVLYVAGDGFAMEYALGRTVVSLDEPVKQEGGDELWSMMKDESLGETDGMLMQQSASEDIDRLLSKLPDRERKIVEDFFGLGGSGAKTLEDISLELDISRERVRQLKNDALARLKIKTGEGSWRYA